MGKKAVVHSMLYEDPIWTESQCLAQITATRGGGLYSATVLSWPTSLFSKDSPSNEETSEVLPAKDVEAENAWIISLPSKFNKVVWIRSGSFVLVEPTLTKSKIRGEIVHVLLPEHVKAFKAQGRWPSSCVLSEELSLGSNSGDLCQESTPTTETPYCSLSDLDSHTSDEEPCQITRGDEEPLPSR